MYFRVDMNEQIASGHMMRCLSIAERYQEKGVRSTFFVADHFAEELVQSRGHDVIVLDTDWANLDTEIPVITEWIQKLHIPQLVVDSYQVTEKYLQALQEVTSVIYIDDRNAFCYPADMVIAYGNWIEKEAYQKRYAGTETKLLLGTAYVPLRREFRLVDRGNTSIRTELMITTGGTDTYRVAEQLLGQIKKDMPWLRVAVISGRIPPEEGNEYIQIYKDVQNMAEIMSESRLAVSAAGTTLFELCACQVPTVCFSFADNQEPFAQKMGKLGAMRYVGDARKNQNLISDIMDMLRYLMQHPEEQERMIRQMEQLVDGCGVDRIIEHIEGQ